MSVCLSVCLSVCQSGSLVMCFIQLCVINNGVSNIHNTTSIARSLSPSLSLSLSLSLSSLSSRPPQRVDFMLKQERFLEALSLAWSFHEGTAKAVLGQ